MTTTSPGRDRLIARLREVLGFEEATTLMEMFPGQRDQLATRADIGRLDGRMDQLDGRMEKFEDRLWEFHQALHAHARTNLIATVSSLTGLTAIFSLIVLVFA